MALTTKSNFLFVRLADWFKRWRRNRLKATSQRIGTAVVFVLSVWGIYGIWDYYRPSIEVTPTEWHTRDPFNSDFVVKNTSHYPLRNVLTNCFLIVAKSPALAVTARYVLLSHYMIPVPLLEPGESTTVQCRNSLYQWPFPVLADLAIRIEYQPFWFLKWSERDPNRFATVLDVDGNSLKWEHRALSEPVEP